MLTRLPDEFTRHAGTREAAQAPAVSYFRMGLQPFFGLCSARGTHFSTHCRAWRCCRFCSLPQRHRYFSFLDNRLGVARPPGTGFLKIPDRMGNLDLSHHKKIHFTGNLLPAGRFLIYFFLHDEDQFHRDRFQLRITRCGDRELEEKGDL
ncbi:hypothetical protein [Thioalkalivibrio sulfidiphilus]|uniref:hypothetical protein n=1 Tax=Thioalkalivibrio sulfidiphilus TaxID=1033854 RepID=UPI003B31A87C